MKNAASLSADLLAPKGAASPAMSTQFPAFGLHRPLQSSQKTDARPSQSSPKCSSTRNISKDDVSEDQASDDLSGLNKVAFTLRLDPERHLSLRLLSVHMNKSSQAVLTEALDAFLDQHGATVSDCACLRESLEDLKGAASRTVGTSSEQEG